MDTPFGLGTTASVAATPTSGNVALPSRTQNQSVRLVNSGSVPVFVEFGTTSAVAAVASTSFAMLPFSVEVFTIGADKTYMAAITDVGTARVSATFSQGA